MYNSFKREMTSKKYHEQYIYQLQPLPLPFKWCIIYSKWMPFVIKDLEKYQKQQIYSYVENQTGFL